LGNGTDCKPSNHAISIPRFFFEFFFGKKLLKYVFAQMDHCCYYGSKDVLIIVSEFLLGALGQEIITLFY